MKKYFPLLLIAILLMGCSGQLPDVMSLIMTPTFTPMDTNTPVPTVTLFPTQDLFAFSTATPVTSTTTPTSLVSDFPTPVPTETETPFPTFSAPINGAPVFSSGNILTPRDVGFVRILFSSGVIYWNEGPCEPRNIKINATVENTMSTDKVLLFLRLREKKNTLNVTDWSSGAIMLKEEDGSYSYNIRTWNIPRFYYYKDAYLEYQLVAITKDFLETGRTQIYAKNLSLVRCNPVK